MSGRATSFYYSFLALPPHKRRAIEAVWDFCRAVDDAVDEPGGRDPSAEIAEWRAEVGRLFGGLPAQTPQGRALAPHISRFGLPRASFDDLIDGVAMDLRITRYETFAELRTYCLRVASAVGLICLEIFGYRSPQSREFATELGIALQLTNIIRDVPADLARGRLYLPLEDLRRFGCDEQELHAGRMTDGVANLLRFQCERAREYYGRARAAMPRVDARRLVPARMMEAIYFDLLLAIERSGCDVFSQRISVPRSRQAMVAGAVWLKSLAGIP